MPPEAVRVASFEDAQGSYFFSLSQAVSVGYVCTGETSTDLWALLVKNTDTRSTRLPTRQHISDGEEALYA